MLQWLLCFFNFPLSVNSMHTEIMGNVCVVFILPHNTRCENVVVFQEKFYHIKIQEMEAHAESVETELMKL